MIVDTSAVLAVLFGEPDAGRYEKAIAEAWPRRMSAVGLLEAAMVVESRGGIAAGYELDMFLKGAEVELVSVTAEQAQARPARLAAFRQGQSSGGTELR